jgi:N-acetylglucosaminyldiphosphoundecaprenol N-acetyl-beta-D-mannosaminyltransferase
VTSPNRSGLWPPRRPRGQRPAKPENFHAAGLARANVLGVGVHAVDMRRTLQVLQCAVEERRKGYVCVTGVHGIMEAQKNPAFRAILNNSLLTTPDGMPTVWVGRWQGHSQMRRVFGPEMMLEVCAMSVGKGYTHFLYGGGDGVAEQLKAALRRRFPGLRIVGTYTPPFRPLNKTEKEELYARVSNAAPDIFWVGLSTPKQEHFMAEHLPHLDTRVMLGVGAAFDVHTGRILDAPDWVKNAGLQWLHRLGQEPRRLWKRYLYNNPRFVLKMTSQLLGLSKYSL